MAKKKATKKKNPNKRDPMQPERVPKKKKKK
jgi:hypothetical protein